jgi:uncharacterized protein (UPF0335 family)
LGNEPKYLSHKFQCPHCGVLAQQLWLSNDALSNVVPQLYNQIYLDYRGNVDDYYQRAIKIFLDEAKTDFSKLIKSFIPESFAAAICQSCGKYSLWVDENIVYPRKISIEPANEDLNEEIKEIYDEASRIVIDSPRGAAALLRLALQLLLKQLGKEGKNINNDIKELVKNGLSQKIQKALDFVRVVGNNAVHPGQIDLKDNIEVALKLFKLINFIANEMITKPKEIDKIYEDVIPKEIKDQINTRDGRED